MPGVSFAELWSERLIGGPDRVPVRSGTYRGGYFIGAPRANKTETDFSLATSWAEAETRFIFRNCDDSMRATEDRKDMIRAMSSWRYYMYWSAQHVSNRDIFHELVDQIRFDNVYLVPPEAAEIRALEIDIHDAVVTAGLNVAGLIEGPVGLGADAINATFAAMRGDAFGVGINLVSFIPVLDQVVGQIKIARTTAELGRLSMLLKRMMALLGRLPVRSVVEAAQKAGQLATAYVVTPAKVAVDYYRGLAPGKKIILYAAVKTAKSAYYSDQADSRQQALEGRRTRGELRTK